MNDRELIELAAKAAGIVDGHWLNDRSYWVGPYDGGYDWNPLDDNGDALRLAVKLGIEVVFTKNKIGAGRNCNQQLCSEDRKTDDPYAATRRAIVRAAAQIGREMK